MTFALPSAAKAGALNKEKSKSAIIGFMVANVK
jgi:hypothetical protein